MYAREWTAFQYQMFGKQRRGKAHAFCFVYAPIFTAEFLSNPKREDQFFSVHRLECPQISFASPLPGLMQRLQIVQGRSNR